MANEGAVAGSQWAKGYAAGERVYEDVMDMIDREAEGSDSLEVSQQKPVSCLRSISC